MVNWTCQIVICNNSMVVVICTCPFVVCNVYTRVLLFVMVFKLPLPLYTAVRLLHLSHSFNYRPQEGYFTLLQEVANEHLRCNLPY